MSQPHPLAARLIERLQPNPGCRILDFAAGSGRNGTALTSAGFIVVSVDDRDAESKEPVANVAGSFKAVVSTHGFLHGDADDIAARLTCVANVLEPDGLLYATFGSTRDARFGSGRRIGNATFAPMDGDERGVAHTYFDLRRLRELLESSFIVESLDEHGADDVAGVWAHRERALRDAVHWFAVARKR